jgi:hypothetical protein
MSLIPGADNEKVVCKDGIQVDHLSENTVGHGTRVRGISDPTTYPVIAGDVGETVQTTISQTAVSGTSFTVFPGGTLPIPSAGVWVILSSGSLYVSGSVDAPADVITSNLELHDGTAQIAQQPDVALLRYRGYTEALANEGSFSMMAVYPCTSPKTISLRGSIGQSGVSDGTLGIRNGTKIIAVRIA